MYIYILYTYAQKWTYSTWTKNPLSVHLLHFETYRHPESSSSFRFLWPVVFPPARPRLGLKCGSVPPGEWSFVRKWFWVKKKSEMQSACITISRKEIVHCSNFGQQNKLVFCWQNKIKSSQPLSKYSHLCSLTVFSKNSGETNGLCRVVSALPGSSSQISGFSKL